MKRVLVISMLLLMLTGCRGDFTKLNRVCPSKGSAEQLVSVLDSQGGEAVSFKANGQCLLRYKDEKGKFKKENFSVKLWHQPAFKMRLQGDIAFDPMGLVLGCNENEYWFAIRLKEISSYYWGRWDQGGGIGDIKISPVVLLEAFGAVEIKEQDWQFSNEGAFDVLTSHNEDGTEAKKIYIYNCDNRIHIIKYFNEGQNVVLVEMDNYKQVKDGFFVPTFINVTNKENGKPVTTFTMKFNSIKEMEFSDKQQDALFNRGQTKGFKNIYRIIDGKAIED